jgi:Transposase DDE domain
MLAPQRTIILELSAHIILGVDLKCARQAHTEANESPADHGGVKRLATVHIGEAVHHLNRDRASGRKAAMSCPQAHSFGYLPHAVRDVSSASSQLTRRHVLVRRASRIWRYNNRGAMRVRRETVEHQFGTIKMRMGATHFLMKTLTNVATEMALHVLAYNLTRVLDIFGVKPIMVAVRA